MSIENDFVNLGKYINPIKKESMGYIESGGSPDGLELLQKAVAFAEKLESGNTDCRAQDREFIRRNITLDSSELQRLTNAAIHIGVELQSPLNMYALAEFAQAAAVGNADLMNRNTISILLAVAAKAFGKFDRARTAYADVVEGLQISLRFFNVDQVLLAQKEEEMRGNWQTVQAQYPNQPNLFDAVKEDPVEEWEQYLIWNTDIGSQHGTLAQADSMLRLSLRLEYWRDEKGKQLAAPAERLASRLETLTKGANNWLALRCMLALGDALMEVSEWDLALKVHEQAIKEAGMQDQNVIALHSIAQAACCELMTGKHERATERLTTVDLKTWESMARSVATVAADVARLVALHHSCRKGSHIGPPLNTAERLNTHFDTVSTIIVNSPKDRTEYLRSLFSAIASRDVNSIMAVAVKEE